ILVNPSPDSVLSTTISPFLIALWHKLRPSRHRELRPVSIVEGVFRIRAAATSCPSLSLRKTTASLGNNTVSSNFSPLCRRGSAPSIFGASTRHDDELIFCVNAISRSVSRLTWSSAADDAAARAMGVKRILREKCQEANRLNPANPRKPPPK